MMKTITTIKYSYKKLLTNYLIISFCIKYKCYIMIELTFLKDLILIRQVNQRSAIFVTMAINLMQNADLKEKSATL